VSERTVTWRDRYPEGDVTCVRCLRVFDVLELDRLLWCEECRARARRRAGRWGWLIGFAFASLLALYVWVTIRPSAELIPAAWVATFVAAVWIGARVGREIVYGAMRFRNARAVEAVPPALPPDASSAPGGGSPPQQ
jgi:hypothetical protein